MEKIISKKYFEENQNFFIKEFQKGKIFIFPTDTIYGIGCIITNKKSIEKIYSIKKRTYKKPLSIIVPNRFFILKNFLLNVRSLIYLFKIPKQKLTLILKLKKSHKVKNSNLINKNNKTIGMRIITNFFQKFVKKLKCPIVATSVNENGEKSITNIKYISKKILNQVDYVIDDGTLNNHPSTIINLSSKTSQPQIIYR